jgi:multiple sugar transport system permease protein
LSILVVDQLLAPKPNSASALSTITFILIFGISLLLVRLFNAHIVGAQKPAKEAK